MSQTAARQMLSWMESHHEEMVDFIRQLVSIESPSDVPSSQQPVLDLLSDACQKLDYRVIRIPGRNSGGQLYARPLKRDRNKPVQLLIGHCDTVWPVGALDKMPLTIKDGVMHGPGVYDMKTGLAQMIFVIRALQELNLEACLSPSLLL